MCESPTTKIKINKGGRIDLNVVAWAASKWVVDDELSDYYPKAIEAAVRRPPTAEWVPPNYDSVKVQPSFHRYRNSSSTRCGSSPCLLSSRIRLFNLFSIFIPVYVVVVPHSALIPPLRLRNSLLFFIVHGDQQWKFSYGRPWTLAALPMGIRTMYGRSRTIWIPQMCAYKTKWPGNK